MNNGNASYDKLLTMWRDEKKKREEAEGELTIIKGIGNNSPEMKSLQAQVEELKKNIELVREDGQVVRQQDAKTKIPIGGYMKTPEAVFERYSIPTEYSNIRASSNRNTSFNSNKQ